MQVKKLVNSCTEVSKISNGSFYIETFQEVIICPVLICLKWAPRSHKTSTRGLESQADAKRGNINLKIPEFHNQEYFVLH